MSKQRARNPQSYLDEEHTLSLIPILFEGKGYVKIVNRKHGQMKFVDAYRPDGTVITFWLKQGWTDAINFCGVQFGMFGGADPALLQDSQFIDYVAKRVTSAKDKGASHALFVHRGNGIIVNYVAMKIDDVSASYTEQIAGWPKRARSTKTPTLYFEDTRNMPDAMCVSVVQSREISLELILEFGLTATATPPQSASKKVTAEIEYRMRQQLFRSKVGDRYGWKCAVTGFATREVLDAAHLPGKDWRWNNEAEDGVLLRTDLHRLLDRNLAEIRNGQFWLKNGALSGPYAQFHKTSLQLAEK